MSLPPTFLVLFNFFRRVSCTSWSPPRSLCIILLLHRQYRPNPICTPCPPLLLSLLPRLPIPPPSHIGFHTFFYILFPPHQSIVYVGFDIVARIVLVNLNFWPSSLPVSTPNTIHHSRLTVCLPACLSGS